MKTLLINAVVKDSCSDINIKKIKAYFPIGLGYIAAVLEKRHNVKVVDMGIGELDNNELSKIILDTKPNIIGISATTPAFQSAIDIAQIAKEINKDVIVIVGGAHCNAFPDYPLQYSCFDISVYGEGERTAVELWDRIEKGQSYNGVKGICFRKGDDIITNPRRELINNLDELPFPARHLFPIDKYPTSYYRSINYAYTVGTSRGCPFSCNFCSCNVHFGKKYRYRNAENIVDELELLAKQYGAKGIYFREDLFTAYRQRVINICNEIIRRGLGLKWAAECRVDTIDEELLRLMKEAGCNRLWGGFESGSQRILDYINKQITIDQMREACALCNKVGIALSATFMMGIPGETLDEIAATVDLAKQLRPQLRSAILNIFVGYPTSQLYDFIVENRLYEKITNHGIVIVKTEEFDYRLLSEIRRYAVATLRDVRDCEKRIRATERDLTASRNQLDKVRSSLSFQLGNTLVRAMRKPSRHTFLLPYSLFKLILRRKRKKVKDNGKH